jgi:hypothetical protein
MCERKHFEIEVEVREDVYGCLNIKVLSVFKQYDMKMSGMLWTRSFAHLRLDSTLL